MRLRREVLPLQFTEPLGVVGLHPAELVAPPVVGLLGDLELAGHLSEVLVFPDHPVGFAARNRADHPARDYFRGK
jgi:hypothetical protein